MSGYSIYVQERNQAIWLSGIFPLKPTFEKRTALLARTGARGLQSVLGRDNYYTVFNRRLNSKNGLTLVCGKVGD